ncbi:MAG: PQQ-binding-like beta-propeller repeat protein [Ignavibacteriales bacterium]|nr:PQQ-binding-like beta-propeller repeat protein [Ignavibacteriales bacterium]
MKKIISTFYILFLLSIQLFAQSFKFGWITDLHIGYPKADFDLITIVRDINKRTDLKFVIATGDISEKGRNEELELAKKILDSLKVKYYIVPGNHDTKWSESACTKFTDLWKEDKFEFDFENIKFIGLCSGIPWRGGGGHISAEDLLWLDQVLSKTNAQQEIILVLHHQLDSETDNWFEVTNRLRNKNVAAILVGHGHANKLYNFNGIAGAMGRSALNRGGSWGYTQVENRIDTIAFSEINKDSIPKLWGSVSKINKKIIPEIDSIQFQNYNSELLWRKELKRTYVASPLIWNDKIYIASRSGIVSCFNLNGKLIWEYDTYAPVFSRPVIDDGVLAVGNVRGDLITLDAATGEQIQTIGLGEPITSQLITFNYLGKKLLMTGQKPKTVIVIGTSSGKLLCYDLNSLEPIWENKNCTGMSETQPLYVNNKIVFGSWDNYLYCIDANSGVMNWKWTDNKNFYYSPAACIPVSDGKNVYVTGPDKYVSAVDLLLGRTVWRKSNLNSWEAIGITKDKSNLLIKSFKDKFFIVSAKDGKIIKEIDLKFGEDTMPSTLYDADGQIVFGSEKGIVYSINKDYSYKQVLFLGTARILSVLQIKENVFAALNMDGNISVFKLNN